MRKGRKDGRKEGRKEGKRNILELVMETLLDSSSLAGIFLRFHSALETCSKSQLDISNMIHWWLLQVGGYMYPGDKTK